MMQSAQHRLRDDLKADRQAMTGCQRRDVLTPRIGNAGPQARMRASVVVVSHPFRQNRPEMPLIEHDQLRGVNYFCLSCCLA